jgi:hypothetical protein
VLLQGVIPAGLYAGQDGAVLLVDRQWLQACNGSHDLVQKLGHSKCLLDAEGRSNAAVTICS